MFVFFRKDEKKSRQDECGRSISSSWADDVRREPTGREKERRHVFIYLFIISNLATLGVGRPADVCSSIWNWLLSDLDEIWSALVRLIGRCTFYGANDKSRRRAGLVSGGKVRNRTWQAAGDENRTHDWRPLSENRSQIRYRTWLLGSAR